MSFLEYYTPQNISHIVHNPNISKIYVRYIAVYISQWIMLFVLIYANNLILSFTAHIFKEVNLFKNKKKSFMLGLQIPVN